ncbi:MAG: alkyl sulfatase dimerization domain-containing protein [Steroidobacteraceae bacterium]
MRSTIVVALLGLLLAACGARHHAHASGEASESTAKANAAVAAELPLADPQDFEDARRGFVGVDDPLVIAGPEKKPAWDLTAYGFVQGDAPATVNPSLWRQAKLNGIAGLFEVVPGVHQVRGYDLSNMSLIDGKTGWIVVDPLTSRETAAAALALARRYLGDKPVSAIIYTHSHVDHFGGIEGVLPADPKAAAAIPIIAPKNFTEEATSENVIAGIGMGRRATYMYGSALPRSATGHVDTGLGKAPSSGTVGIRQPTQIVDRTPQPMTIDGVNFVFQYTPASEAPAELTFYLPDLKAWCGAEIVTHTLHNLYTLRGAKVRDAVKWSGYIDEASRIFPDMEVVFASHHWPMWGHERVIGYLQAQRDLYLYIHDQTLRLANMGYTPGEIAEQIELPESIRNYFPNRGYYGTVKHDSRAVYQMYFGWYDGNPANLDPLPPPEAAVKYVKAMGGAQKVLEQGRAAFDAGDYRWAATLLNHLVFAEPGNGDAKEMLAKTYEQLGYRAESGPWRDEYLTGAYELRNGPQGMATDPRFTADLLRQTPPALFLESMAVRLDGPAAAGKHIIVNFVFDDVGETHVVELQNGVLHHREAPADPSAVGTVHVTRDFLVRLGLGEAGVKDMMTSDQFKVEGSKLEVMGLLRMVKTPDGQFPIVTP